MKIKISKRFIKDIEKITDQRLLIKLRQVIIEATNAQNLYSITNITALVGYSN